MNSNSAPTQKPHAVCIPYPAQGHVNPMLKLAKLLHQKNFHITFILTHYNAARLRKSRGPDALDGLPSFGFEFISDGLPPPESEDATQDIPSLCDSTRKHCLGPFKEVLRKLNEQAMAGRSNPPVSCIVSDGVMSFTLNAAEELGVPEVIFWTTSACGFLGYSLYDRLRKQGFTPLEDSRQLTNGYLETVVDWPPSADGIRLKDFPTFLRTTDPDDLMCEFVTSESTRAQRATAIVLNTFEPLESEVLSALQAHYTPPVYCIGPLHLMATDTALDGLGSNLWKEDRHCIKWLNSRPDNSVVYVNFGSITVMTGDQMLEFAWGLADSAQSFLWVIRPDLVSGETAVLPAEFLTATEGRGLMVDWCPQEEVLAHSAVGGFLTHSGWNSTIEAIAAGVPMICWPFFAEQQTNCRYSCVEWGIGMEIESDVRREVVEKQVRELMVGERGREMKRKAIQWKTAAEAAGRVGNGSSYLSLETLVAELQPHSDKVKSLMA